jgi:hypothetical protein
MKSAMIVHGTKCTLTTQNIMGLPQSIRYSSLLNRQITSLSSCSPTPKAEIIKSGISAPIKAKIKSSPSNEKDILLMGIYANERLLITKLNTVRAILKSSLGACLTRA